jgi:hypothetical protein
MKDRKRKRGEEEEEELSAAVVSSMLNEFQTDFVELSVRGGSVVVIASTASYPFQNRSSFLRAHKFVKCFCSYKPVS